MAVSAFLHDLGLTNRYTVEGSLRSRQGQCGAVLKDRGISTQQTQVVWDATALRTSSKRALQCSVVHGNPTIRKRGPAASQPYDLRCSINPTGTSDPLAYLRTSE